MESPFDRNGLFSGLYGFFTELTPEGFGWLAYLLAGAIIVFIVVNGVLMLTAAETYMERRVLGRFQTRLGPNRVGPFGVAAAARGRAEAHHEGRPAPRHG